MKETLTQNRTVRVTAHLEDKRGIYQVVLNWHDTGGSRCRRSFSTGLPVKGNKKRAEDILRGKLSMQEDILASIPSADCDMLFADLLGLWLDAVRLKVKLSTFGGYQLNVQKVIDPYFRKRAKLLRDLTADDINEFYEDQLTRVKAMTVHKYHANISAALKYAVQKNYISFSVMDKVTRPKAERFVGKFLKQSEAAALFEAVKGHKLELGVIFGAFYGLRRSEVLGLKWDAVDFEANTISIEHTVIETHVDGRTVISAEDTAKTKSSFRTLPLVPGIRERLLEIRAGQEHNRKLCGQLYNKLEGGYVYVDALGSRIKPNYLSVAFPLFMKNHGFRRLRFHDLRHSAASLLLANGVPMKQIQDWLGHSDFAITANTYAHLDYTSKLDTANAMTWLEKTPFGSRQNQCPENG